MPHDLWKYLNSMRRMQEEDGIQELPQWVEETYSKMESALYVDLSHDREYIDGYVAVPVSSLKYDARQARYELLRRRFIMDGWVCAYIENNPNARETPYLVLRAPKYPVSAQTTAGQEFVLEFERNETVEAAMTRFISSGGIYYPTIWERVIVPPNQISAIVQRFRGAAIVNSSPTQLKEGHTKDVA